MRAALALAVLVIAGCATPEPKPAGGDPLSGTRWSLVSFGGSPVLASESTSMNFDKGRLAGSDGCNRYSTGYAASESRLKIGPNIASTRMACPRPIMEEAATFMEVLGRTTGYRVDGDRMTLLDNSGRPMAAFRKTAP
ncbi:MAG TPA: META domain-containing protein [Burkholderiales bacterium]|nr:META domain-containing protein [Burkholderiales bacterium]